MAFRRSLRRLTCPFWLACPFRFDPEVKVTRNGARVAMSGSRSPRRLSVLCPWRAECPIRASADDGLIRFDRNKVEILTGRGAEQVA